MGLKYLPTPIYIAICSLLAGYLLFFAISRRKIDRKGILAVYITVFLMAVAAILGRIVNTSITYGTVTINLTVIAEFLFISLFVAEFTVMRIIDHRKGKLNKQSILPLILAWPIIIFSILFYFKLILNR